tara:strand:- start:166 stop:768 length:603 start_codon:yes stop_codon:yes gene_type:complete
MPSTLITQTAAATRLGNAPARFVAALIGVTMLVGCGGLNLEPQPIRPTNLSGTWQLDTEASDSANALRNKPSRSVRPNRSIREEIQRISRGSGLAFIAQDIQVLKAKRLKIEQGDDSMGVQHWPGVYRDVTWGQRERGLWRVYAGWELSDLLIQSSADDMRVLERYQLVSSDEMRVTIIVTADGQTKELQRLFRRTSLPL